MVIGCFELLLYLDVCDSSEVIVGDALQKDIHLNNSVNLMWSLSLICLKPVEGGKPEMILLVSNASQLLLRIPSEQVTLFLNCSSVITLISSHMFPKNSWNK